MAGQPHQLDVSLCLALEPTARLDAVEVAVDVDLQQHRRVVGRSACRGGLGTFKPQLMQVKLFDEGVDHPNRVVFGDLVVEALGEQGDLASIFSFDESLHPAARVVALRQSSGYRVFTQPRPEAAAVDLGHEVER